MTNNSVAAPITHPSSSLAPPSMTAATSGAPLAAAEIELPQTPAIIPLPNTQQTTLETALASPSNSRIMQLHGSFQELRQNDESVSTYLQKAKSLFDQLAAAGRPISMEDFNLYVFRGLRSEFKDLVTSLSTKAEPISYTDLHSHLLTHEFINKINIHPVVTAPLLPTPSQQPSVFFGQRQSGSNAGRRGCFCGGWRPNNRSSYRGNHGYGSAQNFSPTNSPSGSHFGQQGNRVSYGSSQYFGQQSNRFGGSHHTIKCQLCYDYGHTAQQCSQLSTHHVQANVNLAFNTVPTTSPVTWFPDTGANHHVTPDLVSMTSSEPYLGNDHLHVGDGKGLLSRLPLKTTSHQTQAPLDLIFSDVWGPSPMSHVSPMAPVSPDVALSSAGSPTSGAVCVSHMLSDLPNSLVPSPAGSPSRFASPTQPSPLLHRSTLGSSTLSPPGLDLCVDLSHFSLQQDHDSVSSTQPQVARTHSMVLRPRSSKTANLSQEPVSFKAADKYLIWHKAMQEELQALHSNDTWSLVPFAPSMNVVGSRWVYKIKRRADGCVDRYKARLVARGFTQQEGVDYYETFSPVIKPTTIRLVLTIAVTCGWQIHQLDVHNAFLNGILQEEDTASYGLHITRDSSLSLHGFTDADWAGSIDDRKSTGGYLVYLGATPISWKSGKQRTIARSSTEAEYKALADGTAEILWIRSLLSELHFPLSSMTTLWCDNLGATFLSLNPVFHARTKHVEVDYHFVRDRVAKQEIQVRFISSKDQLADVLTKPLPPVSFALFRSKLRVESPPSA
ncbi:uncharacterized protein [Populus alba]|uniref:uncharacterized protein n=1 Tax=Populus alba TaxID=43335 RepID=UPI003CC7499C